METAKTEIHKQKLDQLPIPSAEGTPTQNSESTAGSSGGDSSSGHDMRLSSGGSSSLSGERESSVEDTNGADRNSKVSDGTILGDTALHEAKNDRTFSSIEGSGDEDDEHADDDGDGGDAIKNEKGADEDESRNEIEDELADVKSTDDQNVDDAQSKNSTVNSWADEAPPLSLNYDAIKHIATYYLPGDHGACVDITEMRRGGYHEIRVLHFADGWSCIGRFAREEETLAMFESQLTTTQYVQQHTNIPVPNIFFIQPNQNHVAGAAFLLMERMEGQKLSLIWDDLDFGHKLDVLEQLAYVVAQLAILEFDRIGCIKPDGTVGPFLYTEQIVDRVRDEPHTSTADYMCAFLRTDDTTKSEEARSHYSEIEADLRNFLQQESKNPIYNAPYRLIHADFEPRNMFFEHIDPEQSPRLTAIIDWDYAYSGPLYYLCDYPYLIQDDEYQPECFYENKCMRKWFVQKMLSYLPKTSETREEIRLGFRQKNTRMNRFKQVFMECSWNLAWVEVEKVKGYLTDVEGGSDEWKGPYGATEYWKLDSEPSESEDDEDEDEDDDKSGRESEAGGEDGNVG